MSQGCGMQAAAACCQHLSRSNVAAAVGSSLWQLQLPPVGGGRARMVGVAVAGGQPKNVNNTDGHEASVCLVYIMLVGWTMRPKS